MSRAVAAGFESDFGSDCEFEQPRVESKPKSVFSNLKTSSASNIPWKELNGVQKENEETAKNEPKSITLQFEEHFKQMIKCSDIEGLKLLIEDGLELDYSFSTSFSLISYAVFNNDVNIVEMLVRYGFKDVDNKIKAVIAVCSNSYTNQSAKENSIKILDILAENKFDINGTSSDGNNSIHIAIKHKNIFLIPLLIKYGADLHHRNCRQQTPICLAVTLGQVETVKIIASFFVNEQNNIAELTAASNLTHNVSIRSHLTSLVNDPSKIGTEVYTDEITFASTTNDKNQLSMLLKAIGLKHLIPLFTKHSFTFKDLFRMDSQFVKNKFNLDPEEIEKLTSITNELKINSFDKNSYFVGKRSCFNAVDICISISNLYEHLDFVESSITSLCDHIQANKIKNASTLKQAIDENFILLLQKEKSLRSSIKTFGIVKDEICAMENKIEKPTKNYIPATIIMTLTIGISTGFLLMKYIRT